MKELKGNCLPLVNAVLYIVLEIVAFITLEVVAFITLEVEAFITMEIVAFTTLEIVAFITLEIVLVFVFVPLYMADDNGVVVDDGCIDDRL